MRNNATVSIYHQLTASKPGICNQSSADKTPRWINIDQRILIRREQAQSRSQHLIFDFLFQLL